MSSLGEGYRRPVTTLTGQIQHYDWGQVGAITNLVGGSSDGEPEAEFWMGAHPKAPSRLGDGTTLIDAIDADPVSYLGSSVADRFGGLPFLFKILAVEQPLSVQAHPSLELARAGFAAENAGGLAVEAPDRNYRDPNHKPELVVALTRFHAKCGFRPLERTRELFDALCHTAVAPVQKLLAGSGDQGAVLRDVLDHLLGLPAGEAAELARAVVETADALLAAEHPVADEFWPDLDACGFIASTYPDDIGAVIALLLNHVVLEPGEGLFLGAGNLHCYLSGMAVELMANSDNVVRGGLTAKHIDRAELMKVVDTTPMAAPIQTARGPMHAYDVPVADFALTRVQLEQAAMLVSGPAIVLVTEGMGTLDGDTVAPGQPRFVPASAGSVLLTGYGLAWVAGV